MKAVTLARYAFAIGGPPDLGERLGPTMNLSEYIVLFVCVAIMGAGVPGLGDAALTADVPGLADAGGFNRHTFLCGQSGSGKTYSLGVILEQLLTETDLRIVVLDPNSDFVRLGEVRGGADAAMAERYLADAAFTQAVFSFVPPSLIDRAVTFHQGEALIAGKISPQPTLLRFGARITEEGGADVPATWAAPR